MTPEQAVQKLNALLDDSMSAVKPPLRYWDAWPTSTEQDGYAVATRYRYVMTRVSRAKFGALLGLLERSWLAKGYRITSVNPHQPAMFAVTPDGSAVGIAIGAADNITASASVSPIPVIRDRDPFGTPIPDPTTANGNLDIIPRYDDPFWSK
ncbi:hypothetical protein P3T36_005421 [Kitasatospora sp. MAP12-15]|uniref:hypothetical protein n=1 Tax=unclassified Kitasatospora TaxID=2633591 RepID=UPI002472FB2F|nr:hypothetical protein [Kitasatospora sp. MAP12-44]MDH6109778.1 hypothetical protein [Kitasatospora sp. MAP12-44]